MWAKKSRIKLLECGDRNTNIFHWTTKIKRGIFFIPNIKDDNGALIMDQKKMGEYTKYFEDFYKEREVVDTSNILKVILSMVTIEDNESLTKITSLDEIKETIFLMNQE